jgi:sulfur relay (sulfurtransferase) complex TusBCD TusD component (DsrE family)
MPIDPRTIFLVVMGAPYESELTTSLFRLVDAALDQQHRVLVWTCGGATTLTMRSLGDRKPRNPLDLDAEYPSTARLIRAMLARGAGRLEWYICRQCMEERGASEQVDEVKIQPPFRFLRYLEQADVCMIMGVK